MLSSFAEELALDIQQLPEGEAMRRIKEEYIAEEISAEERAKLHSLLDVKRTTKTG